jgi:hypothetical protein
MTAACGGVDCAGRESDERGGDDDRPSRWHDVSPEPQTHVPAAKAFGRRERVTSYRIIM